MDSVEQLIEQFKRFPGIGPRQARRFVFYLLTAPEVTAGTIAELLTVLRRKVRPCTRCFRFFEAKRAGVKECSICADASRLQDTLMIVAKDVDVESVEQSGVYRGLYFVLGGIIQILEKKPETKVRVKELLLRVRHAQESGLKEIIIAFNSTPDGDHTAEYLAYMLMPAAKEKNITFSTLGRGLSSGLELEYSDRDTIQNAVSNRAKKTQ